VDGIIGEIHQCRLAPGHERVYAPGELEAIAEARYLAEGIPLNAETLADLAEAARNLGIDPAVYIDGGID
jgi:LDH2 family malate/lactate/ureidoglycolate dehydrogenase